MSVFNYNLEEFNWHCKTFFDYRAHLSKVEMDFILYCMHYVKDNFLEKHNISSKTYNHRIHSHKTNSSRLGFGIKILNDQHRLEFKKLFKHKCNEKKYFDLLNQCDGCFVAWDLEEKDFRLYFYFKNYNQNLIPEEMENKFKNLCNTQRLIAFTISKDIEEKFYYYPKKEHWSTLIDKYSKNKELDNKIKTTAVNLAFAISNTSNPRFQFDIDENKQEELLTILNNPQLTNLAKLYKPFEGLIDTISINKNYITAYFW